MAKKNTVNNAVIVSLSALIAGSITLGHGIAVQPGIMAEALEAERKVASEKAKSTVQTLIRNFDTMLRGSVAKLRAAREVEAETSRVVKAQTLAFQFFGETGNPLPFFKATHQHYRADDFCDSIGITVPKADHAAWSIPAGWKPASTAPTA